jgi:hypothetical protein
VDDPPPLINETLSQQLSRAFTLGIGYVDELDDFVRVPPGWVFSLKFATSTFIDPDGSIVYYTASEAGIGQLPDWLAFDNKTLTFDGRPPLEAEGTRHEIIVVGSDRFGYGDVQQKLLIVVGSHDFRLVEPFPVINATLRSDINYTVPLGNVRLDNATITPSNVTIDIDLSHVPSLTYDSITRLISGHLPTSLPNDTDIVIPVQLHSSYGDNLTDTVLLRVIPDIFVSDSLPAVAVKPGGAFELDLKEYSVHDDAVFSAVITPPQSASWLSFDAGSMKLSGTAPKNKPDYGDTTIEFSAFDRNTGITGSSILLVQYGPRGGLSHGVVIALAILGGVLGLALLIGLVVCYHCCIRSRQETTDSTGREPVDDGKSDPVGLENGKSEKEEEVVNDGDKVPQRHMITAVADMLRSRHIATYDSYNENGTMTTSDSFLRSSWGSSSLFYSDLESGFGSPVVPSRKEDGVIMTRDGLRGKPAMPPSSTFDRPSWGSRTHSSFYSTDIESNFGSLRSSDSLKASTTVPSPAHIPVQRFEFRAIWAARNKLATKDSSSTVESLDGAEVVVATRGRRLTAVEEEQ